MVVNFTPLNTFYLSVSLLGAMNSPCNAILSNTLVY
nr:MAG TPA: hypothetical protein [Crassvirales sp.]